MGHRLQWFIYNGLFLQKRKSNVLVMTSIKKNKRLIRTLPLEDLRNGLFNIRLVNKITLRATSNYKI